MKLITIFKLPKLTSTLPVKVLKSPIWEGRLADFVTIFEQHRLAIISSLSIRTSLGVDSANRTLSSVHQNVQSVDQKLNTLLLFRTLDSPHEKEIMKVVSTKGGAKACLDDDAILKELMTLSRGKVSPSPTASKGAKSDAADRLAFAKVKKETKEDVDDFLEKNMVHFERKLELQKRQIVKQIEDVVIREGDRVISALSGPHDRIIDSVSSYYGDRRCCLFLQLGPTRNLERDGTHSYIFS